MRRSVRERARRRRCGRASDIRVGPDKNGAVRLQAVCGSPNPIGIVRHLCQDDIAIAPEVRAALEEKPIRRFRRRLFGLRAAGGSLQRDRLLCAMRSSAAYGGH